MPEHGHPRTGLLLVDPDRRVRLALGRLMTSLGLVVLGEAGTVDEALRLAHRTPPEIALVEPLMPTLSAGCGLMSELATMKIPVLALATQTGLRQAALNAGACSFLSKDSPPDVLLTTLARVSAAAFPNRCGETP